MIDKRAADQVNDGRVLDVAVQADMPARRDRDAAQAQFALA
jgi:hypothetical protein